MVSEGLAVGSALATGVIAARVAGLALAGKDMVGAGPTAGGLATVAGGRDVVTGPEAATGAEVGAVVSGAGGGTTDVGALTDAFATGAVAEVVGGASGRFKYRV